MMSDVATLTAQKQAATALFQEGNLVKARDAYFAILIDIDSEETSSPDPSKIEIKIACLNNLTALFLKTKKFKEVIELSRQVLLIDPSSVKAYFRQSQALSELELNNDAVLCLQKLLLLEPQNTQAKELLYVVMDKLNPLDEDSLPSPPSTPAGASRPEDGKVYPISRMPGATSATRSSNADHSNSNTSSVPEEKREFKGAEPVPITFGGGWDFMNPEWKPADDKNDNTSSTDHLAPSSITRLKEGEMQEKSSQQVESASIVAADEDDSAQIFLDEAERARIKNQLFAEALQKSSHQAIKPKKNKSKKSVSASQKEVVVDEIVSKTVEELSLAEKTLVAKVESKKAKSAQKSSTKTKKIEGSSSLKKKKVVSTRAKT